MLSCFLLFFTMCQSLGAQTEVSQQDSALVVALLEKAARERGEENRMLYFGRQFIGLPYVAHTLEEGDSEHLIVNLHEFDCTTFVETVAALSLCDSHGQRTFSDFCHWLTSLRYRDGKLTDYTSRLHYFTWWGEDNERRDLVECVNQDTKQAPAYRRLITEKLFNTVQTVRLNYMTTHPELYKHLKAHPEYVETIREYELITSGKSYRYIPKKLVGGHQSSTLGIIEDGDILAMITSKTGLDTSHLGIAVWQNGRLHMLNASSVYKKVVLDTQTLYKYQQKQSSQLGIRVFRLK